MVRRQRPVITRQSITAILRRLLYGDGNPYDIRPLYQLALVDEVIHDSTFPKVEQNLAREYALNQVITNLLYTGYVDKRNIHGLPSPEHTADFANTLANMQMDSKTNIRELLGWSYLYHRYARTDLGIQKQQFATCFSLSERTLQRHEDEAIKAFGAHLIVHEQYVLSHRRQQALLAQLPIPANPSLTGRQSTKNNILAKLAKHSQQCIWLSGDSGAGKTALCLSLATTLIENDEIDTVIWIENPENPELIFERFNAIQSQPYRQKQPMSVRDYLQKYRTLVIVDNFSVRLDDSWNDIFTDLAFATLIVTAKQYQQIPGTVCHAHLDNLSKKETASLIMNINSEISPVEAEQIYELTSGNPGQIYEATHFFITGQLSLYAHRRQVIWSQIYDALTSDEQCFLCLIALSSGDKLHASLAGLFSSILGVKLEFFVMQEHLQNKSDFYLLQPHFRSHISERLTEPQNKTSFSTIISLLVSLAGEESEYQSELLVLVENILQRYKSLISETDLLQLIQVFHTIGIQEGDLYLWERVLRSDTSLEALDLFLARIVCLRKLSRFQEAIPLLKRYLELCGRHGLFEQQSHALIEQAIIQRMQGAYEQALINLERCQKMAKRYKQYEILQRINHEYAQIAIDLEDKHAIQELIQDPEKLSESVYCELLFIFGQYHQCITLIDQGMSTEVFFSQYEIGVLVSLRARCHVEIGRYREALADYNDCVNRFAKLDDHFAVCRAKTGLAAVLIETGAYDKAREFLQENQAIQHEINDAVGLEATRHNLQVLTRIQANQGAS